MPPNIISTITTQQIDEIMSAHCRTDEQRTVAEAAVHEVLQTLGIQAGPYGMPGVFDRDALPVADVETHHLGIHYLPVRSGNSVSSKMLSDRRELSHQQMTDLLGEAFLRGYIAMPKSGGGRVADLVTLTEPGLTLQTFPIRSDEGHDWIKAEFTRSH